MCMTADCLPIDDWKALLTASPPPAHLEHWLHHLESCVHCQTSLEGSEEDAEPLLRLAREVGDPTRAGQDSAESRILERLPGVLSLLTSAAAAPLDLYFLQAASDPDLLGRLDQYEVQEVIGQGGMGIV